MSGQKLASLRDKEAGGSTRPARDSYHFALDGVRGFAALSVVFYHLGHWLGLPHLATNGALAVDLFFCLSGYVLAQSYGYKAAPTLTMGQFVRIRLVRLMPIIILATVVSGLYAFVRVALKPDGGTYAEVALAVLLGSLTLPYFNASKDIGGPQLFPLNGPQFTLFLEIVANFVWFAIRRQLRLPLILGAVVLCFLGVATFGSGGDTASTFLQGFPRVGFSFLIGVAIYQAGSHATFDRATAMAGRMFIPLVLVMVAVFYYPFRASHVTMLLWIGVASPLLVLSGARYCLPSRLNGPCLLAGGLSYPIYALHYPIFCWFNGTYQSVWHVHSMTEVPLVPMLVVGLSVVALKFYDRPLRRALAWPNFSLKPKPSGS